MPRETLKWLEDVRDAGEYILSATQGKTLSDLSTDRTLRQAVERNFEIIGEAINRISRVDGGVAGQLTDRRRIVAFRNTLVHGYDNIDLKIVWAGDQDLAATLGRRG
ncbi:MAG: DUF86 domain-containing protein [Phycisphaerales bacterium]|nr:MAG: DUF86 domain-containing protein [Phycisphaerales bacterium]